MTENLPASRKLVSQLFMTLQVIFGHKWTSSFQNEQLVELAKREWGNQIEKLPQEDIKRGVTKCRALTGWPPTLPEFIELCKLAPSDLGIPSTDEAYEQAQGCLPMTHAIVLQARQQAKTWDVALCEQRGERATRKRFDVVYEKMTEEAVSGRSFKIPKHLTEKYSGLVETNAKPTLKIAN